MIAEIIQWLIIGLIIGAIARLLLPGRDSMGCLATALVGIIGSVVGGYIGRLLFPYRDGSYFAPRPGWILSIIGAMLVLFVLRRLRS